MNKIKRQWISNHHYNTRSKKLRITIENDQKKISKTSMETFSIEFFYEIFDYLDGIDIYSAFSNLNHRFQQLLNSSSILFKIKLHAPSAELYKNFNKHIELLNRHQIFSLDLNFPLTRNHFFSSFTIDSSLDRLQSLTLNDLNPVLLTSVLVKLPNLPRLSSLNINMLNVSIDLTSIYRIILTIPMLKYYRFSIDSLDSPISLPTATNEQLTTIEYLVIEHPCTFNELATIISYIPKLSRLYFIDKHENISNFGSSLSITLLNLTHISIKVYYLTFDEFESFIRKIESKVKVLHLIIYYDDVTYLNGHRWEQLILQSLPQLEEFYLKYHEYREYHNYEDESLQYLGEPNQFTSSFWMARQWIFETEIDIFNIIYSVRPYRKRWYEYDTHFNMSSNQLGESTRLILTNIASLEYQELLTFDIIRALTLSQFYHLEISEKTIFIGALIQAVGLLSELKSLKVHSLSLDQPRELCEEEVDIFSSTEDTSKITKVYLKKMIDTPEIYFLMVLCPYMEYLQVDCINNMDAELFVRDILKKINDDSNDYLRSLYFKVPAADDRLIQKLKQMINSEKLLVDYTIRRESETIYLQWK